MRSKSFQELYEEFNKDVLAQMFRNSKFGYGYNVPEDQKISYEEALKEAKKFREQRYTNKYRLYYHISPLKLRFIKSMGDELRPKLSFFALDPRFCIELLKYKGDHHSVYYLHRCHLKGTVNLFNFFSIKDRQKIQGLKSYKSVFDLISDKESDKTLWWRIWETPEIVNEIQKLGYKGIALDFSDNIYRTNAKNKYGIALFQGSRMQVIDYAECDRNYLKYSNIDSLEWKDNFDEI